MFGKGSKGKKKGSADDARVSAIAALFAKYADADEPTLIVVEDAMEQLCEDLGIDGASDVRFIVLLWKLGASRKNADKPMAITDAAFRDRMLALNASSLEELRALLPSLDPGFLESDEFYEFYTFAFDLNREVPRKTLLREVAVDLLPIVIDKTRAPHLDPFLAFLREHPTLKDLTLDQWKTFVKFNQQVSLDSEGYNAEDGAWPLLFDDYVEWRAARK